MVLCAVSSSTTLRDVVQCGWEKRDLAGGAITGKGKGNGTHILDKLEFVLLTFELFARLVLDVTSKSVREFAYVGRRIVHPEGIQPLLLSLYMQVCQLCTCTYVRLRGPCFKTG